MSCSRSHTLIYNSSHNRRCRWGSGCLASASGAPAVEGRKSEQVWAQGRLWEAWKGGPGVLTVQPDVAPAVSWVCGSAICFVCESRRDNEDDMGPSRALGFTSTSSLLPKQLVSCAQLES